MIDTNGNKHKFSSFLIYDYDVVLVDKDGKTYAYLKVGDSYFDLDQIRLFVYESFRLRGIEIIGYVFGGVLSLISENGDFMMIVDQVSEDEWYLMFIPNEEIDENDIIGIGKFEGDVEDCCMRLVFRTKKNDKWVDLMEITEVDLIENYPFFG